MLTPARWIAISMLGLTGQNAALSAVVVFRDVFEM
jgi:hypothetical protein